MRIYLQLPDEVYDRYVRLSEQLMARGNGQKSVSAEEMMEVQLDRFSSVAPMDRIIIVDPASREGLERVLSGGFISSGADLLAKVSDLASLEIGKVRLDFTTRQWDSLKSYATKNGISLIEATRRVVKAMEERFFDIAG